MVEHLVEHVTTIDGRTQDTEKSFTAVVHSIIERTPKKRLVFYVLKRIQMSHLFDAPITSHPYICNVIKSKI